MLATSLCLLSLVGAALGSRDGDDRAKAQTAIATLRAQGPERKAARESLSAAEHALRRADEARASGDRRHAAELEALAREHAETGVDLGRAMAAEKKLVETQKKLAEIETKITRARAVLEETLARRGRAQAKLDELEKRPAPPPPAPVKPTAPGRKGKKPAPEGGKP